MRRTLAVLGLTLLMLALIDLAVAGVLHLAEARGRLGALVGYFEYGRSVPGKLARWQARPEEPGNLQAVAWRPDIVESSAARFAAEPVDTGPVIRSYGMSFVNNILREARTQAPGLRVDTHGGPSAPPNFAYALYLDDRGARRTGDVAVLGVLSSAVPAVAALSNRTWAFEQPAPFTYPVFRPEGDGLRRIEPLVASAADERALAGDPAGAAAWARQLAAEDSFHAAVAFAAPGLDRSPFARLVRRSLATGEIARRKAAIVAGEDFPHAEALRRIILAFARDARAAGEIPFVMLIQSRDRGDADLLAIAGPLLRAEGIAHLATAEHYDPRDTSGFESDGHYRREVDAIFAAAFLRHPIVTGLQAP